MSYFNTCAAATWTQKVGQLPYLSTTSIYTPRYSLKHHQSSLCSLSQTNTGLAQVCSLLKNASQLSKYAFDGASCTPSASLDACYVCSGYGCSVALPQGSQSALAVVQAMRYWFPTVVHTQAVVVGWSHTRILRLTRVLYRSLPPPLYLHT